MPNEAVEFAREGASVPFVEWDWARTLLARYLDAHQDLGSIELFVPTHGAHRWSPDRLLAVRVYNRDRSLGFDLRFDYDALLRAPGATIASLAETAGAAWREYGERVGPPPRFDL